MKKKNIFLTKKFAIYLLRWIISGIIMIIPNELFLWMKIPSTFAMVLASIVGAFIFFLPDSIIFKNGDSDE